MIQFMLILLIVIKGISVFLKIKAWWNQDHPENLEC